MQFALLGHLFRLALKYKGGPKTKNASIECTKNQKSSFSRWMTACKTISDKGSTIHIWIVPHTPNRMMTQTHSLKTVEFDLPAKDSPTALCNPSKAWARVPSPPSEHEKNALKTEIKTLLKQRNAVLVSHYYVDSDLQDLAEETGGCVSDSLEMARFGRDCQHDALIVAGVRFMGETSKILSPHKRVFMPDLEATCSLDLACPIGEFTTFCDNHPDRTVVVYANTSAAVKARADWMVTSSIALQIVRHLHEQGQKILWAPDRHLGAYIQSQTGADMLLWQGSCVVHDEFKALELKHLKVQYPKAWVLVHPESPPDVVALANVVGSTSQLIAATKRTDVDAFIVATDNGILHKMRQAAPNKLFIEAPTAGNGATCKSCAHCPWMAMNGLQNLRDLLKTGMDTGQGEVFVDVDTTTKAVRCVTRMLDFAKAHGISAPRNMNSANVGMQAFEHIHKGIGPA